MSSQLSNRIRLVMKEQRLKAAELARIAGVSSMSVSQWINGPTTAIKGEHAVKIGRKLGYNPEWLLTGEGEMRLDLSAARADAAVVAEILIGSARVIEALNIDWPVERVAQFQAQMIAIYQSTGEVPNYDHALRMALWRREENG